MQRHALSVGSVRAFHMRPAVAGKGTERRLLRAEVRVNTSNIVRPLPVVMPGIVAGGGTGWGDCATRAHAVRRLPSPQPSALLRAVRSGWSVGARRRSGAR